jgi:hypothetical protein
MPTVTVRFRLYAKAGADGMTMSKASKIAIAARSCLQSRGWQLEA